MDHPVLDGIIRRFTAMKAGWDAAVTLGRMREDLDALIASYVPDLPFTAEPVDAGGVPAEWVIAGGVASQDALLYLHGGGFATGSIRATRNLAAVLSREAACRVLVLGYRLAPEHAFPAALDDAVAAWRWMSQPSVARRVAIGGDSAGAGLAL
ncbi:MAG TPA: alpha/beta hydrolase fold domain-containing protein, partial [Nevskiaceae bacterium]|nr:alpha/beta hydrolase fold domain-containing protein [Nevskiaceae bacterium]